jgi:hypothetical protein
MPASLHAKAAGRVEKTWAGVRDALLAWEARRAFHIAKTRLYAELAKVAVTRPMDAAVIYADLAGRLTAEAALMPTHVPHRPEGCGQVPSPEDLYTVAQLAFERVINAAEEARNA